MIIFASESLGIQLFYIYGSSSNYLTNMNLYVILLKKIYIMDIMKKN